VRGHVESMGEIINIFPVLTGKVEEKRTLFGYS
jgi:hypothetical protein